MKICNCSLAGTDACKTCSSYPYSYHIVNDLIDSRKTIPEHSAWFRIGEVLVDESKGNITPEQAIRKIKEYMRMMEKPERKENDWIPCSEQPKNEFLDFLWNVINPNDMEKYLSMYHSKEEKRNG